jgi:hypothetical protein
MYGAPPYTADDTHDVGLSVEFGVGKGGTLRKIAAALLRCSGRFGSAPPPRIVVGVAQVDMSSSS